ncbi:IS66 family insertion sequence element accessory protein TnpA [Propionivibrio sp.]|uniref:IS66 family insertion sequence element accessory protein TnpA n=1 Tax=Propionivibrio sp. TaxID=2212460 RepID=UPI003BF3BC0D
MARRGAEFWRGQLEAWHRSDLTQRDYCATHGLSEKSFYRWRAKEKESIAAAKSSLTLVPISVASLATSGVVRLHSPGGWRIELPTTNVPWLAGLLRQLP